MALITCPHCGQKVSSEAQSCVHCGTSFTLCPECGAVFEGEKTTCPECGYSIKKPSVAKQEVKAATPVPQPQTGNTGVRDFFGEWKAATGSNAPSPQTLKTARMIFSFISAILLVVPLLYIFAEGKSFSIDGAVDKYLNVCYIILVFNILSNMCVAACNIISERTDLKVSLWIADNVQNRKELIRNYNFKSDKSYKKAYKYIADSVLFKNNAVASKYHNLYMVFLSLRMFFNGGDICIIWILLGQAWLKNSFNENIFKLLISTGYAYIIIFVFILCVIILTLESVMKTKLNTMREQKVREFLM